VGGIGDTKLTFQIKFTSGVFFCSLSSSLGFLFCFAASLFSLNDNDITDKATLVNCFLLFCYFKGFFNRLTEKGFRIGITENGGNWE